MITSEKHLFLVTFKEEICGVRPKAAYVAANSYMEAINIVNRTYRIDDLNKLGEIISVELVKDSYNTPMIVLMYERGS